MRKVFENKTFGFRMTLACMALSLITAIVYTVIYSKSRYMSWRTLGIMVAGVALAAVIIALRQYRFAPSMLLVANFVGLLLFGYHIYFYISSVVTGIQFSGFPLEFFVNVAFFAVTLVLSIVCVFMRQTEE